MVWGVVFRGAGTLAIGALLSAIFGDVALELLEYTNHPDHWLVNGLSTIIEMDVVILLLSVFVMLMANVLKRRVEPGRIR